MSSVQIKRLLFTLALLFVACFSRAQEYLPEWKNGYFDIHSIATGKGENTLLVFPDGTTMLIDCGDVGESWKGERKPDGSLTPGEWVARYVKHFTGSDTLDYFLLTHFHSDHMCGVNDLAKSISFRRIIDRDYPNYSYPSSQYFSKSTKQGERMDVYKTFVLNGVSAGAKGEKFVVGSHKQIAQKRSPKAWDFDVWNVAANGFVAKGRTSRPMYGKDVNPEEFDENMFSTVMLFRYGPFYYYHGGDVSGNTWPTGKKFDRNFESTIARTIGHPVTVAKADHHGTRDSCNPDFLWQMRPQALIFHAFEKKHTWSDTIARMLDPQMPGCKNLYTTGERGYVLLPEDLQQKINPAGHIVVRVYEGGKSYQIFILDFDSTDYRVKSKTEVITVE